MKKVFALILALCMVFALCACGQTAAPAATEAPAADTAADAAPAEDTGWAPDGPVTMIVAYKAGNGNDVYDTSRLPDAKVKLEVPSEVSGYIGRILAEHVGLVSMHLGGGRATKDSEIDLSVGVILHKKVGDKVEKGESLATIHASSA